MSLINSSTDHIYCSNLVSNHVLVSLIRFVSRFTVYLCNVIYFSTIFNIPCNRFTKILHFDFWEVKTDRDSRIRADKASQGRWQRDKKEQRQTGPLDSGPCLDDFVKKISQKDECMYWVLNKIYLWNLFTNECNFSRRI